MGLLELFYEGRPISKVEITGILRSIDRKPKRITFHIDDGTGVIRCIKFLDEDGYFSMPGEIGQLVLARGMLERTETNTEPYSFAIKVVMIQKLVDVDMESYQMLAAMDLYYSVYSKPQPDNTTL